MDASHPKVPAPCGGNVGAAQAKPASAAQAKTANAASAAPKVPAPCGGNVGAAQAKPASASNTGSAAQPKAASAAGAAPRVPAPCGGNVGSSAAQRKTGGYALSTQMNGGAHKVVARSDGHSVGSVEVRSGGGAMELVNLSVDATHRKNGVGRQLIAQALQAGMSRGNGLVKLESQDDGSGRLTRWYASMGFTRVGTSDRRLAVMQAPASTVRAAVSQGKTGDGG